jgi:hypothetical protein
VGRPATHLRDHSVHRARRTTIGAGSTGSGSA